MEQTEKVITVNALDDRLVEHIRNVLVDAVAKSLVKQAVKEVYSTVED